MTDSDRLNAHLNRAVRRRSADPAPAAKFVPDAVNELARKHVTNPHNFQPATDQAMDQAEEKIRQEALDRKAEIMLGRLPALYRDADFPRTREGLECLRWITGYREGLRNGLVILGNVGTGKTYLAAAIARSLMTTGRPVPTTLITVSDLLAQLRPSVGSSLGVDMAQFALAPVLILDDLGQENQSEWTREQMYRLAHSRSHNGLPTIVTSNLTGLKIKEQYEARTVQRLFGGATLIQLDGESRREMPF